MINYELVPSLFDRKVRGVQNQIQNKANTHNNKRFVKNRILNDTRKILKKRNTRRSMRLIVPAPPDVGTMRRQAVTSPASLIPSAGATSSSPSTSPVNIVNYRRLYNECTDG